jgi:nucleoside-diphosphate-sugar epimerase
MTTKRQHDNPILVTGAAGAVGGIGRNLTEFLLAKGHIRHYGLLAGAAKAETIATVRELLSVTSPEPDNKGEAVHDQPTVVGHCPCCGGHMHIIETFEPGCRPRHCPSALIRIDTS